MAQVIFYEKPGCINNTRQKALLKASGHEVIAKNLLAEPWNIERLKLFFHAYPVAEWFNPAAPRVKSGEVAPQALSAEQALVMMLADPLLIRRPLMQVAEDYRIGFDAAQVNAWIGLSVLDITDLETCSREQDPCPQTGTL
ncbi:MAG: ArsC/Spx/MgsR family protein [Pseudomonadota bacterium]|nr:ArsC/Spx/MgsR family protein [Pseudomonadota bacterium]